MKEARKKYSELVLIRSFTALLQVKKDCEESHLLKLIFILLRHVDDLTTKDQELIETAISYYIGSNPTPTNETGLAALKQMLEDTTFKANSRILAQNLVEKSGHSVYEYEYTHMGSMSLCNLMEGSVVKLLTKVGVLEISNFLQRC